MEVNFMKAICCLSQMENRSFLDIINNNILSMEEQLVTWSGKRTEIAYNSIKSKAKNLILTLKQRDERKTYPLNFRSPKAPFLSIFFYILFFFGFSFICYVLMDWDQGLLKSSIALSNGMFRASYEMQRMSSNICLFAVATVSKDPIFQIGGVSAQTLSARIGSASTLQDLPKSLLSFNEELNTFITQINQYNMCNLNIMEEFNQIIEACRIYYPNITIKNGNSLTILEQASQEGASEKVFPFPDPTIIDSTTVFGINLMMMNAMIKNLMSSSLDQITSGQIMEKGNQGLQTFIKTVIRYINWNYYSVDFLHHTVVSLSARILERSRHDHQ